MAAEGPRRRDDLRQPVRVPARSPRERAWPPGRLTADMKPVRGRKRQHAPTRDGGAGVHAASPTAGPVRKPWSRGRRPPRCRRRLRVCCDFRRIRESRPRRDRQNDGQRRCRNHRTDRFLDTGRPLPLNCPGGSREADAVAAAHFFGKNTVVPPFRPGPAVPTVPAWCSRHG